MANSDNVLRGGLTPKHVDVPELMKVLDFRPGRVPVLRGDPGIAGEWVYGTPAPEFRLSRLEPFPDKREITHAGPQVLLVVEGEVEVSDASGSLDDRAAGAVGVDRRARRPGLGQRRRHRLPGHRRPGLTAWPR